MSNKARFIGRVVTVQKTEKLGKDPEHPFLKRVIVLDDSEAGAKRPNTVPFEAIGDKCEYLDGYKVGDVVTVDYWPNGNAWNNPKKGCTQYFGSFRIAYIQKGAVEGEAAQEAEVTDETAVESDGVDDMPF